MKNLFLKLALILCGFLVGVIFMVYRCGYILEGQKGRERKFHSFFNLLDRWLECKENGNQFSEYFHENNIKSVAIYRMGKLGSHLKYELNKGGISISYVIDEMEDFIYDQEIHYNIQEKLPLVDAVIVTSVDEFEEVKNKILKNNKFLRVISMEDITDYFKPA